MRQRTIGIVVVIAAAFGCASKEDGAAKREAALQPAPPAPRAPPPPGPPKASVELPARGFRVADVFGKTVAQLENVLGKSEKYDPGRLYDGYPRTAINVEFENGKAALIRITAAGFSDTEADRKAVLDWAGATPDHSWKVDAGSTVELWDPEARKRAEKRTTIGDALGEYLKRTSAGSGHARGELDTVMLVRARACDRGTLAAFKRMAMAEIGVDFAAAGFLTIQCGLDGPSISAK